MNNFKIVCDGLADIPQKLINEYDIDVVPLSIVFGDKEYMDGIDITKEEFYKMLRENEVLPKTSQVTYAHFREVFEKYIKEGKKILYIGGSSNMSGTYQSAVMAKNDIDGEIYTFDSLSASIGMSAIVLSAARLLKEERTIEEIIEHITYIKENISVLFTVDNLEYLQKGGRLSLAKATIGNLLNIKPILGIEEGYIKLNSQARGKKQVISKLVESIKNNHGVDLDGKQVVIGCGDNDKDIELLKNELNKQCSISDIISVKMGSCICAHTGPAILGIACC
ncbi:DegV family protein [Romboutsia maritimum]|uniref:DegV family protein n=1 Tax=Romboutsia maritimum TaxID=2020948 RepID=A0A371ITC7_9FIRM|nr:DegV family protein [Romboutsia maritimum]RDY23746.1 DegV family protein [Romboutsia maritimum]